MQAPKYIRLCRGVTDRGTLILPEERTRSISDYNKDWYESIYLYNDEQFARYKEAGGTVAGIRDVLTNRLVFDFDHESDPDYARQEARTVVYRLTKAGVSQKDVQIFFSGSKGFNIVITLDRYITPKQAAQLATKFASDVKLDLSLYDHSQILRIPGTRHQRSGLFKIPLTFDQFFNSELSEIKELAASLDHINPEDFQWGTAQLPDTYFNFKEEEKLPEALTGLDFSKKPRQWRNCKWALLQGDFKSGERDHAMIILAATCRGLGYDKETTYYMCKSALKKSWAKHGQGDFTKEELWNNIIEQNIFSDRWEGGQYSCKSDVWLNKFCKSLGEHRCGDEETDKPCVNPTDMSKQFSDYACNFEKNVIKTGIFELDDNAMLLASTLNGLLGQPGAGKTSMALNYLRHTSKAGIPSVFLSLDMGMPIIYAKLIQKLSGMSFKEVLSMFKERPDEAAKYNERIKEEYSEVGFNFRSGLTVPDIKTVVLEQQELTGKPVKLLIIDYLECIAGPYSDQTANAGFIANQLKDLANDLNLCILLLLQTQKHSTPDIADPLITLKAVKGSSLIEQSCSTILTLWREGYNPATVNDDKFISFAVVKNRFGSLWQGDFSWDGVTGNIQSLSDEQRLDLKLFKEEKFNKKLVKDSLAGSDWS